MLYNKSVEYVKNLKFLGLIIDCKLSWRKHIYELRDRCQGDLRLLTVVAGRGWGADFYTLRELYIALIHAKLDYASFIYETTAPSYLKVVDRI